MSSRMLEIADRKLGDRCCEPGLRPALSTRDATALANAFELLAHPIRLQLLDVLARNEGKVCVCDLESAVPVKQPTVSHHLRLLREAGLIGSEKVGQWVHYYVRRDALRQLRARMSQAFETIG